MTSPMEPGPSTTARGGFSRILRRSDVFLLGVVATFNLNLVPTLAASGWAMPLLMAAAALSFVLPQAVAVVELNRQFPGEGGMAQWVRHHFGDFCGFLTAWCYWGVNVVYVPTLMVFLIGNLRFLIDGEQDESAGQSLATFAACLAALWLVVGLSVLGFGVSRWFSNAGGVGMLLALLLMMILCGWSVAHRPLAWPGGELPGGFDWTTAASFGVFCLALVGPELGAVLGDEIRESKTVVPWSVWRVSILAVACYTLGAGVLQIAAPAETIHSVKGVLTAAVAVAEPLGATWSVTLLGALLCISVVGAAVTWFAGASRMLWVAAHDGALPARFARLHPRFGTPVLALLVQAATSTVILATSFVGAKAHQVFITLVDLSVVLQLIPFFTMFAALLRAGLATPGRRGKWFILAGALGAASSLAGIVLAFVPSRKVESVWAHEANLIGGCLLFLGSCCWIFVTQRRRLGAPSNE